MPTVTFYDNRGDTYYSGAYYVRVTLAESYNASTNTSTVTVSNVEFRSPYNFGGTYSYGKVLVNGTVCADFEHSYVGSQTANSYVSLGAGSGSVAVEHNASGAASVSVMLAKSDNRSWENEFGLLYSNDLQGIRISQISAQTVALTTHARASTVSATNGNFGSAITITISRANSAYTHTLKTSCAGHEETLMTKGTTYPTVSWTPSVATYAPLITGAMSATATITLQTYSGNTLLGTSTTTCTLTFKAADVAPSVSIATSDPTGNYGTYGSYLVAKSKIKVTLTPTLKYGATVSIIAITANGSSYSTNPATTDYITSASNNTVTAQITDSRGQTANASVTIPVAAFIPPRINSFSAYRCTSAGVEDNTGAYMLVRYDVEISNSSGNTRSLKIQHKQHGASSWTTQTVSMTSWAQTGSVVIAANVNYSYDVQLILADSHATSTATTTVPTAYTRLNFGAGVNGGIAIGKVSEENKVVEIAGGWKLKINGVDILAAIQALQS